MGCWDETCALTNVAIAPSDTCVMVVVRVSKHPSHFGRFQSRQDFKNVVIIAEGEYDWYGGIEGFTNEFSDSGDHHRFFFAKEAWDFALAQISSIDDYFTNSLKESLGKSNPFEDSHEESLRLIYEEINEERRKNGEEPREVPSPRHAYPDRIGEFSLVTAYCNLVRRPLTMPSSGPQHGEEYRKTQLEFARKVVKMVRKQHRKDIKNREED